MILLVKDLIQHIARRNVLPKFKKLCQQMLLRGDLNTVADVSYGNALKLNQRKSPIEI